MLLANHWRILHPVQLFTHNQRLSRVIARGRFPSENNSWLKRKPGAVSKVLLIVISLVVILVVTLIVTGIHLSNPYLRKKVVEALGEKFHANVELKDFHVYLFPGARIEGSGLTLRHEGRTDVPPLISIDEFSAQAGILGLLGKPWKIGKSN